MCSLLVFQKVTTSWTKSSLYLTNYYVYGNVISACEQKGFHKEIIVAKTYHNPRGYEPERYPAAKLSDEEWKRFLTKQFDMASMAIIHALHASGNKPITLKQAEAFFPKDYEFSKKIGMGTTIGLQAWIRESPDLAGFRLGTNERVYWIVRLPHK